MQTRLAVDHVGLSVPNLEQAIDFFVEIFGCALVFRAGPYENVGYFWPGEGSPERATVRLALLTHNDTHNIELLEYTNKPRNVGQETPRPSDPGGVHLAFYVDDIELMLETMRMHGGIRILGGVEREVDTPNSGTDWIYTLTPWGLVVELTTYRPGMPYESTTDKRLAVPCWVRETDCATTDSTAEH
jgi:catechol 2,3-dioxygenase-like lactoylglutathione lyase family enzyme